ncbi:RsbT co-antagonist protein RsbRA [Barrientosiimonas marina]|uniref:STAS domain-containing protein n=1 Tax=Lentibacillus kimchii TaxID=1542911 RepID=A0ABW2UUV6_9BACI
MDKTFKKIVLDNSDQIVENWLEEVDLLTKSSGSFSVPDELLESTNQEFANVIFNSIQSEGDTEQLKQFAEKLVNLGWEVSYITDGLQEFRRVAIDFILSRSEAIDTQFISELLRSVDTWIEPVIRQLVNEYSGNWENILSLQRDALQELAAPLIPIMDNITVMPLVGTIDTERAKSIMENLLYGVIEHDSEVVLIDITGVPVVDTMVAHHIIQAADAVRLVGATCILVGIRPEIAQTIVNLGIDLSSFPTQNSLKKGFVKALELTGRQVIDVSQENEPVENLIDSLGEE